MRGLLKKLFGCWEKTHVQLSESTSMVKKVGEDTAGTRCDSCHNSFKQNLGYYEADNGSILCIRCRDGNEAFRRVVVKSHCCPYFAEVPCDFAFTYDLGLKFKCDLCLKGPFEADAGRFVCAVHGFNACWECVHPPCGFIVCPHHPYLPLDNSSEGGERYTGGFYTCRVCKRQGRVQEGRYHCPIQSCRYDLCWKCYTAPVYCEEQPDDHAPDLRPTKPVAEEPVNANDERIEQLDVNIDAFERSMELENEEIKEAPANRSISNIDIEVDFNIPHHVSPSDIGISQSPQERPSIAKLNS